MKVRHSGFTLVEVILALAIGGLIMTLAFLGVRQATVQRHDNQRKADLARYITAVRQYANDHQGKYPQSNAELQLVVTQYIVAGGSHFRDPSGTNYTPDGYNTYPGDTWGVPDPSLQAPGFISAHVGAICMDATTNAGRIGIQTALSGGSVTTLPTNRNFAAAIKLQSNSVYCLEVQ